MRTSVITTSGVCSLSAVINVSASANSCTFAPESCNARRSTKRIALSSSAIQISAIARLHRQRQRENRVPGPAAKCNLAAVFMRDFLCQCQSKSGSIRATGDQRHEQRFSYFIRHAAPVVDHIDPQRTLKRLSTYDRAEFRARANGDGFCACLKRVAHQIEQHLQKTVRLAANVGQARIVIALKRNID